MASVLLFSVFIAILSITLQLYYDYQFEKAALALRVESIVSALEPGLTNSLWMVDDQSTTVILKGILNIPEIYNVSLVTADGKTFIEGASPKGEPSISRAIELYSNSSQSRKLGELTVLATLEPLYTVLLDRALGILAGQAIRTVVIVAFFLFVFWWLVSRHLEELSNFALGVVDARRVGSVTLSRRSGIRDELSRVADAFNLLSKRILEQQKNIEELRQERNERSEEARADLLDYLDFFRQVLGRIDLAWNEGGRDDFVQRILNDLMCLMSLVGETQSRHPEEFDLPVLMEQAIETLESKEVDATTELQMMMDESLPRRVLGDQQAFRCMINYLIGGLAVLSRPSKLVLLGQVISSLDSQHLRVRINAEDNGDCLPQEWLDFLTHVPARLSEQMTVDVMAGLLKLVVFREWVSAAGGEYGFKAEAGKGNSVWFEVVVKSVPGSLAKSGGTQAASVAVVLAGFNGMRQLKLTARLDRICHLTVTASLAGLKELMSAAQGDRPVADILLLDGSVLSSSPIDCEAIKQFSVQQGIPLIALAMPEGMIPDPQLLQAAGIGAVVCDDEVDDLLSLLAAYKYDVAHPVERPFVSRSVRNWSEKAGRASEGGTRWVLLADDDVAVLQVTRLMLESMGYAVDTALHGDEAVKKLQTRAYSAVILDCWMPVMDGFEAARRIRRLRASVPIIALTGSQSARARNKAQEAGMDTFLSKPIQFDELQRVLASLV
jgi:two-component system sensor histidine kinase BarA